MTATLSSSSLFICFSAVILCGLPVVTLSATILALPGVSWSHYNVMKIASMELATRGHKVILISFWKSELLKNSQNLKIRTCARLDNIQHYKQNVPKLLKNEHGAEEMGQALFRTQYETCECIFADEDLLKEVKTSDLLLADVYYACSVVLQDFLRVPRVSLYACPTPTFIDAWFYGIPVPLSYIPVSVSGLPTRMSFLQRIVNIVQFIRCYVVWYYANYAPMDLVRRKYNITPARGFFESGGAFELVLIQTASVINYARPLSPNVKLIGPLSPGPPRPLSRDLESFMSMRTSNGEVGVVLVCLGAESDVSHLGDECVSKLLHVFSRLKEKVICKLTAHPNGPVPSNVKILPWVPQNDILGHVNTRLFISHMGHNGFAEAAYHGVPVVGAPLLWEQHDNTRIMEHAGIGIGVDIRAITADQLYRVMRHVIDDPRYGKIHSRNVLFLSMHSRA